MFGMVSLVAKESLHEKCLLPPIYMFLFEYLHCLGKRKRSLFQEQGTVLRELQASAEAQRERHEAQHVAQHEQREARPEAQQEQREARREAHRERLFELMLEDSRAARELEFAARSHQAAQSEAFGQALLGVLDRMAQAMADRNRTSQL